MYTNQGELAIRAFGQCSVECSDKQYINEQWIDLIGDGCIGRF